VRVRIHAQGRVEAALHAHRDWIAREVLALEFDVLPVADAPSDATRVEVDDDVVAVVLERATR
jgi:hypothetical protein